MITSKDNEKLKLARKLGQKKHREKTGLFVTEGEDLARAGLAAGREPYALLVHPDLAGDPLGEAGEPVEPLLLDGVATLASGTRVIGIWPSPGAIAEAKAPAPEGRTEGIWVYLDRIADPGNVGTIIRTVDALLDAIVIAGPGTADHLSPHAVRASMGSVFSQPVIRAGIEATPEPRIATVPRGGARPGPHPGPVTLCLGAEREGLSPEILKECEIRWTIPLRPKAAESLNVAAAAAIACERISSPVGPEPDGKSATGPAAAVGTGAGNNLEAETGNGNG